MTFLGSLLYARVCNNSFHSGDWNSTSVACMIFKTCLDIQVSRNFFAFFFPWRSGVKSYLCAVLKIHSKIQGTPCIFLECFWSVIYILFSYSILLLKFHLPWPPQTSVSFSSIPQDCHAVLEFPCLCHYLKR